MIRFVLFLPLLFASSANAETKPRLKLVPYVFEAADGTKVDAELGVLTVAENRASPSGNEIELAFVRFRSTALQPGSPIVYIPGGPGGSGIDSARGKRFPLFMAMRGVGDVIALDPRGGRRAKPFLLCHETLGFPLATAPSREAYVEAVRARSEDCAWFWRELQRVDLAGYNTQELADDLDDLRRALGAKTIDLWAISHGTHVALTMMRRHPRSIGRAILAGVEGPDHTLKMPAEVQRHLEDIGTWVRSDPAMSERVPSFTALLKEVFELYRKQPVTVEVVDPSTKAKVPVTVNEFVLQLYVAQNIGSNVIGDFPRIYEAASHGDVAGIAGWWLRVTREPLGNAMSYTMDCASGATAGRLGRIRNEAQRTLLGNLADYSFPDVCPAWNVPDLGDEFRQPVHWERPALFISGTLDARTPVSNAEEVRRGFSLSTHLVLEGAVHSDALFLASPEIVKTMQSFLRGEELAHDIRIAVSPPELSPLKSP